MICFILLTSVYGATPEYINAKKILVVGEQSDGSSYIYIDSFNKMSVNVKEKPKAIYEKMQLCKE